VQSTLDAEVVLQCFFDRYPALYAEGLEDTRAVPWSIDTIGPPGPDRIQVVRLHQRYGPLEVHGSETIAVLKDGALISIMGRSYPPSMVPAAPALPSETAVIDAAEQATGLSLRMTRRYYDPESRRVIAEFQPLTEGAVRIDWDETSAVEVRRWTDGHELNLVPKTTTVQKYTKNYLLSPGTQPVTAMVDLRPKVGSYDDFCLDHGTELENGEPKLCRSDIGTDDCHGSYYSDPDCQSLVDWTTTAYVGYPTNDAGVIMNLYFWVHDLAEFARHWWTAYDDWTPWSTSPYGDPENLKIVRPEGTAACSGGACFRDFGTEYRIVVETTSWLWPTSTATSSTGCTATRTTASFWPRRFRKASPTTTLSGTGTSERGRQRPDPMTRTCQRRSIRTTTFSRTTATPALQFRRSTPTVRRFRRPWIR
jgi:hypothetical protein